MFASLENKGKRREKGENQTLTEAARYLHKNENCAKRLLFFTKTMGVYIGHPIYENTRKPNILAKIRDKEVIHQNEVGLH